MVLPNNTVQYLFTNIETVPGIISNLEIYTGRLRALYPNTLPFYKGA